MCFEVFKVIILMTRLDGLKMPKLMLLKNQLSGQAATNRRTRQSATISRARRSATNRHRACPIHRSCFCRKVAANST
jgi:hypothetical protein